MPKKVFAVSNVKVGPDEDQYFEAGSVVDPSKFTKKQLMELHEAGAIEIRVVDEDVAPDGTAVTDVVPAEDGSAGDAAGADTTDPDATSVDE